MNKNKLINETAKIVFGFLFLSMNIFAQKISYNIKDFGAVGDGITLCTSAINKAIETCHSNGGGTVVIPSGVFKSGTIFMKEHVEMHLESGATLSASTEHKDFPKQPFAGYRALRDTYGWYSLIYAESVSNIAITGLGTIDGNGSQQKPRPEEGGDDMDGRPRNILFISCKHIRIEGIKMINSGMWNQHYLDCEDVIIDRVEVYNHSNRNNDAVDIDGCRRVVISNSIFDSDDDGITLKSTGAAPTENIAISNCIVSSFCNAIKAGTESTGGFRNISITNCVIKPSIEKEPVIKRTKHGHTAISLEIVDGGTMEGVTISNISIEGTECPLYLRLANRGRKHTESAPAPPVGKMRNISISNVTAYNTGNYSSSITSIPGSYIENVSIEHVQFFNQGGLTDGTYIASHTGVKEDEKGYPQPTVWKNLPSSVFFIRHVKNLTLNHLMFGSNAHDPRIPIVAVDVKNLSIGKSMFAGPLLPEHYVRLDHVEGYDIDKPSGWGAGLLIEKIE